VKGIKAQNSERKKHIIGQHHKTVKKTRTPSKKKQQKTKNKKNKKRKKTN